MSVKGAVPFAGSNPLVFRQVVSNVSSGGSPVRPRARFSVPHETCLKLRRSCQGKFTDSLAKSVSD